MCVCVNYNCLIILITLFHHTCRKVWCRFPATTTKKTDRVTMTAMASSSPRTLTPRRTSCRRMWSRRSSTWRESYHKNVHNFFSFLSFALLTRGFFFRGVGNKYFFYAVDGINTLKREAMQNLKRTRMVTISSKS